MAAVLMPGAEDDPALLEELLAEADRS